MTLRDIDRRIDQPWDGRGGLGGEGQTAVEMDGAGLKNRAGYRLPA